MGMMMILGIIYMIALDSFGEINYYRVADRSRNEMTLNRQLHGSKTHKQGNDPACPVCQRHIAVADAIKEVDARHLCGFTGPNESDMSFYALPNGQTFIVQNYKNDAGFEIYATISHNNSTKDTLDSLRQLATLVVA
jgi:hypothetical protein